MRLSSLVLLCLPALAWALSSDREQPVHIKADQVVLDEREGVSHYTGNVQLDRGSLHLRGDRMTVHQRGRELQRIDVNGSPAYFSQLPDGESTPVEAWARHITYRSAEDRLVLEGEARVRQSGNLFQGGHIVYDTARSRVNASGGEQRERVHVIIQPEERNDP